MTSFSFSWVLGHHRGAAESCGEAGGQFMDCGAPCRGVTLGVSGHFTAFAVIFHVPPENSERVPSGQLGTRPVVPDSLEVVRRPGPTGPRAAHCGFSDSRGFRVELGSSAFISLQTHVGDTSRRFPS